MSDGDGAVFGGCLCGAARFRIIGPLAPATYCHCADCRKCTGGPFNVSIPVDLAAFALLSGAPKGFTKNGDSGEALTRHFCPECGSPLYTASPAHPDRIYVKAGALDDPSLVVPGHQNWTESAVSWASIPPGLPGRPKLWTE